MKKLYHTNDARQSAIDEITRQIDALGRIGGDLSYVDYRAIVRNLSDLRNVIRAEMTTATPPRRQKHEWMPFERFKVLKTGDHFITCIDGEMIEVTATGDAFYNHNANDPQWEIETEYGFIDCDDAWREVFP